MKTAGFVWKNIILFYDAMLCWYLLLVDFLNPTEEVLLPWQNCYLTNEHCNKSEFKTRHPAWTPFCLKFSCYSRLNWPMRNLDKGGGPGLMTLHLTAKHDINLSHVKIYKAIWPSGDWLIQFNFLIMLPQASMERRSIYRHL